MTEPAEERPPTATDLIDEGHGYSKDKWDLVFEQLAKRKLFKIGLALLALLYASAIYSPLIANDRPWTLVAIDYKAYKDAIRTISAVATATAKRVVMTPEEYLAQRSSDQAPPTLEDALAVDRGALAFRVETIRTYLPEAERAPLALFEESFQGAIDDSLAGDREAAGEKAAQAKTLARALRKELKAADPDDPESEGVQLVAKKSHPMSESLSHWELWLMSLWMLVLSWPLWNRFINRGLLAGDRDRIRRWRRRKAGLMVAIPTVIALVWAFAVGGGDNIFEVGRFKPGLSDGSIRATNEVSWPWIAYGYAETHTEEGFRPPTWTHESEMDPVTGYYLHGLRVPKADPITGYKPPESPVKLREGERDVNDSLRHMAGTDELGRDFMTRMLWGGRVSLAVGLLSAALLTFIGVVMGSIAGYFGGWLDTAIMRVIEILQSLPAFFLILLVMAFTDPNVVPPIIAIVVVIALIRWTGAARIVRGEFMRLREAEFVVAAQAMGFSSRRTIFKHVLPNAMSPVLVYAAFAVASGILTESAISFLGFGISHPGASWGSLVNESRSSDHWWIQVFPGFLIFLTVTCYNLVGDAVRDALDPKMKI